MTLPAAYAGPQGQFPGLDQVNVLLPAALAGNRGILLWLSVDNQNSNSVTLTFQ